jgi:hypothetical protein
VIRFPTAAIRKGERPLQELIDASQPPVSYHIHAQGDGLGNAEQIDGAGPIYIAHKGPAGGQTDTQGGA